MKAVKKLLVLLMVLCLFCAFTVPAYAAGEEYTYRVRVYAGRDAEGLPGGGLLYDKTGFKPGDHVSITDVGVSLPADSKYYIMGLREAGKDNSEAVKGAPEVQGDMDLVVAYGIKGNQVEYTVNYVIAGTDTPLLPSETFYGNIGDYMVAAYRYVEGYQPQAYNLGRTLSDDPSANVYTFEYTSLAELAAPAAPAVDNAGGAVAVDGGAVPLAPAPEEIIDLDDTPLGLLDMGKDLMENGATMFNRLPVGARIGLVLVDATLIALVVWLIVHGRKKKNEA